ncbi:MAG: long-chain fatty acid--CoA ligase, partial [Halobacteria archaeon]|nr:long-chain fatty acid--CoA ligase [Halobacteria archaeon]
MVWNEVTKSHEEEYEDEVIGDDVLPGMFESAVERWSERKAQQYKGGVYDRSLTGEVVPEAPEGEYTSITYDEMGSIVRNL